MPDLYRVFPLDKSARIAGPPSVLNVQNDDDAIVEARKLVAKQDLELWRGTRRVATLRTKADRSPVEVTPDVLRARAAQLEDAARQNPAKPWQAARRLARIYRREADAMERAKQGKK